MKQYLNPEEYFRRLPVLGSAAGFYITDTADQVLLLKPGYRDHWTIPGGVVEENEAPDHTAEREAREEIGLDIRADRLLVVAWLPAHGRNPRAMIRFTFDGGVIADPAQIRLGDDEVEGFDFFPLAEAARRLHPAAAYVLPVAAEARATGVPRYLSHLAAPEHPSAAQP